MLTGLHGPCRAKNFRARVTAIDTVSEFSIYTLKRYRQLQVKELPKVPTWRLERDSNPRPSGRKASSLPMRHQAPQRCITLLGYHVTLWYCTVIGVLRQVRTG